MYQGFWQQWHKGMWNDGWRLKFCFMLTIPLCLVSKWVWGAWILICYYFFTSFVLWSGSSLLLAFYPYVVVFYSWQIKVLPSFSSNPLLCLELFCLDLVFYSQGPWGVMIWKCLRGAHGWLGFGGLWLHDSISGTYFCLLWRFWSLRGGHHIFH